MPSLSPVRILTTTNIVLSGLQTLQSVSLVAGERVAVNGQTSSVDNGIYLVVDGGSWSRTTDFATGAAIVPFTDFGVLAGTYAAEEWRLVASSDRIVGADAINFSRKIRATELKEGRSTDINTANEIDVEDSPVTPVGSDKTITYPSELVFNRGGLLKGATSGGAAGANLSRGTVRLVATTNVNIATGGLVTIDGVVTVAGNKVLLTGQTAAHENGIYTVAAGAWSRHTDFNTDAEFVPKMFFIVDEGSAGENQMWFFANDSQPTLGSTAIVFEDLIEVTDGLQKNKNTIGRAAGIVGQRWHGGDFPILVGVWGDVADIGVWFSGQNFIKGHKPRWDTTTTITVGQGAHYSELQGEQRTLHQDSSLPLTLSSPSANTWYYVYAVPHADEENVSSFEGSTTAPVLPFTHGTAAYKTIDQERRYICALRTNASSQIFNFTVEGDGNNPFVSYLEQCNQTPFRALAGGTATAVTSVACSAVVPPTSRKATLRIKNNATAGSARIYCADMTSTFKYVLAPGEGPIIDDIDLTSTQTFSYSYSAAPTGGGLDVDVLGYIDRR